MDRPILFSAPMVRALLEGRKTQTRRLVGQFNVFRLDDGSEAPVSCLQIEGEPLPRVTVGRVVTLKKLKAAVGDRLWVREAITASGALIQYLADRKTSLVVWPAHWQKSTAPAMHMPRAASRLTLTVTDVRVQRLQDISEEDAEAEGALIEYGEGASISERRAFNLIWEHINGTGSWEQNPWVAAYTFTVERRNIDAPAPSRSSSVEG